MKFLLNFTQSDIEQPFIENLKSVVLRCWLKYHNTESRNFIVFYQDSRFSLVDIWATSIGQNPNFHAIQNL